ncbi:MAG: MBL fold metallo-hydrolase [Gemmatimonadaceae bacterium]|nr:MBL fold metallo-hydrolase [Gemmatimonadaceae bacterium]
MKLTFLGTGTSFGVPQIGCHCAVCRSPDPRDRRTRCGALVECDDGTRLLIDTPPELRLQLLSAGVDRVDAVLFTHEHADHTHGIDDVRALSVRRGAPLPMYASAETLAGIGRRFPYVLDPDMRPLPGTTKPEGAPQVIAAYVPFTVGAADILPVAVPHGRVEVLGFRIGALGYVTDAKSLPERSIAALRGVRVLVLNALLRSPHPTHLSIGEAVALARVIGAERTFLTHLTHDISHVDLETELPGGVAPAFDGLVVRID